MPKRSTKSTMVGEVAHLKRPEAISPTRWRGVKAYLLAIAAYYPKAFPSQERLAAALQCDVRSIRRYQVLCQQLGLLYVTPDAGVASKKNKWSKTNQYHILIPDKLSGTYEDNLSYQHLRCSTNTSGGASLSHSSNEISQPSQPSAGSTNVLPMSRREEPSSQVPRKAPPPRKQARDFLTEGANRRGVKRTPAPKQRWQVLASYFSDQWRDLQSHSENKDLRAVRDVENQAQCRTYINARFADHTDEQVYAHIDEFMRLVSQRHVRIKNGQSAWMAFTGAWGRQRAMIDPDVASQAIREYVPPSERAQ